jgi:endonuclease/exonuclease/phosphatase family metal-dependent hydrolase
MGGKKVFKILLKRLSLMKIEDRMKLIITALLIFAMLSGTVAQDTTISIKVMAYNIKTAWGGTTLEPIADVIVKQKPDYVALQELDSVNSRSSYQDEAADEAAILAQLTEMHYEFARGISFLGGAYGIAMLSKLPYSNTIKIPLPGEEARVALLTDIDLSEGSDPDKATITFISTHWMNGDAQAQLESAQIINAYIDDLIADNSNSVDENWPFILLGDLNAVKGSGPIDEMCAHWETGNFDYGIDWLFFRPAKRWNWIRSFKLSDPNDELSDHEAVVSEIELLGVHTVR